MPVSIPSQKLARTGQFSYLGGPRHLTVAVRSSEQLWKAWGTPAVNENDCSWASAPACDLGVALIVACLTSRCVASRCSSLDKTNTCFILRTFKTVIPLSKLKQRDSIIPDVPDSGLQWEKQADSKWILIFPAIHCRWFLAEWLHSCRVVRGWTV